MTQPTPTQDLVAKDLHGYEWRFKHIFRGTNVTCGLSFSFLGFPCFEYDASVFIVDGETFRIML